MKNSKHQQKYLALLVSDNPKTLNKIRDFSVECPFAWLKWSFKTLMEDIKPAVLKMLNLEIKRYRRGSQLLGGLENQNSKKLSKPNILSSTLFYKWKLPE